MVSEIQMLGVGAYVLYDSALFRDVFYKKVRVVGVSDGQIRIQGVFAPFDAKTGLMLKAFSDSSPSAHEERACPFIIPFDQKIWDEQVKREKIAQLKAHIRYGCDALSQKVNDRYDESLNMEEMETIVALFDKLGIVK